MSRSRKKRPYRKSRAFDASCRSHGGCPYCMSNRMHKYHKRDVDAKQQQRDLKESQDEQERGTE